jgi:hypothetical protein
MNNKYLYPLLMIASFTVCSSSKKSSEAIIKNENARSKVIDIGTTSASPYVEAYGTIIRPALPCVYIITDQNDTLALVDRYNFINKYGKEYLEENRLGTAKRLLGTKAKVLSYNLDNAYKSQYTEKNGFGLISDVSEVDLKKPYGTPKRSSEILIQFKDNAENLHEYYTFSEDKEDFVPIPKHTACYDVIRYKEELCGPIKDSYVQAVAKLNKSKPNMLYLAVNSD